MLRLSAWFVTIFLSITLITLVFTSLNARAESGVIASIKPIHSLVAGVMEGVEKPGILLESGGSPHGQSLKPSQASAIQNAKLIFWVGPDLESFLEKPLETIGSKATVVSLIDSDGVVKLANRELGETDDHHGHEKHASKKDHDHDKHDDHKGHDHKKHDDHDHEKHAKKDHDHDDHEGHDHDKHDDHKGHDHKKHDDHDHEKHAKKDHDHDDHEGHDHDKHDDHKGHDHKKHDDHDHEKHAGHGHHDHAHGEFDPHIWLDPENAKAMVSVIRTALSDVDPANAARYEENATNLQRKLDTLTSEATAVVEPAANKSFVVFHDAYQYFEKRFGLQSAIAITVNPEVPPSAQRVTTVQEKITKIGSGCVFAEPQFTPKVIDVVTEGTGVKTGILDPLGSNLENGPELYFSLIKNMAQAIGGCLGG